MHTLDDITVVSYLKLNVRSLMSCSRSYIKSVISTFPKPCMTADCSLHATMSSTASVDISIFAKELPGTATWVPPTFLTSKRASPAFPRSRLGLDLGKLRRQLAIGLISLILVAYHMCMGYIESKFRLSFDSPHRLLGLWNFKRRGGFSDAAMHVNIFN